MRAPVATCSKLADADVVTCSSHLPSVCSLVTDAPCALCSRVELQGPEPQFQVPGLFHPLCPSVRMRRLRRDSDFGCRRPTCPGCLYRDFDYCLSRATWSWAQLSTSFQCTLHSRLLRFNFNWRTTVYVFPPELSGHLGQVTL